MKTIVFPVLFVPVILGVSGCQSPEANTRQASVAPASSPAPAAMPARPETPPDSVPAIARREVIRRQERIRQMDEAALRASQAMANDDLEGAVSGYRRAVNGLP